METHINNINNTSKVFSSQTPKSLGDLGKNLTEASDVVTPELIEENFPESLNQLVIKDPNNTENSYVLGFDGNGHSLDLIKSNTTLSLGKFPYPSSSEWKIQSDKNITINSTNGVTLQSTEGNIGIVNYHTPTNKFYIQTSSFELISLPEYVDEAAATTAGLNTNQVYKTPTGELRIKL